ncbi:MAG: oxygenase MpaB family protein [Nevskia sp.]|nr:oxygenase MpaB family protein [Nevskia sp.]
MPESSAPSGHYGPAILPGGRSRFFLAEPLRRKVEQAIIGITSGAGAPRINFLEPAGDPGLFGPDSICWRVHGDFAIMLVGGVSALLLQALHPLALAGVWDHSNFRQDILGRLRRTSAFVGGTTFAGRRDAERLIQRVRRIHETVVGTAPDGRHYAAGDPRLLTWVHVAEMSSFLRSHQLYSPAPLSESEQDRYYHETAVVAELLGARGVPKSVAAVERYYRRMLPQLDYSERAREVHRILLNPPVPHPALKPMGRLFIHAGEDLLPDWAQDLLGIRRQAALRRTVVRPGLRALAPAFRWALRNGAAARARLRIQAAPAH